MDLVQAWRAVFGLRLHAQELFMSYFYFKRRQESAATLSAPCALVECHQSTTFCVQAWLGDSVRARKSCSPEYKLLKLLHVK